MAKNKSERIAVAAGRTRGSFVSVYRIMSALDAAGLDPERKVLVQIISENAACKNQQEARQEAASKGILGWLVALRRCGNPWERVEQIVIKDVEAKNEDGFNEAKNEDGFNKVYAETKKQEEK